MIYLMNVIGIPVNNFNNDLQPLLNITSIPIKGRHPPITAAGRIAASWDATSSSGCSKNSLCQECKYISKEMSKDSHSKHIRK